MAGQVPYTVKFPDGYIAKFQGPSDLSDTDAFTRATQERAVKSGKIQTTWFGGTSKALGEDPKTTGALMMGAGLLTGTAPIVAAAPLAARWLQYATEHLTGQDTETPTLGEQAVLAGTGVASAYGPKVIAKTGGVIADELGKLGGSTLPQAAAKAGARILGPMASDAEALTPTSIGKTASEMGQAASNTSARMMAGVSADDLALMKAQVAKGMKPTTAAKIVSGGNAKIFQGLMNLYRLPAAGLK